MREGIKLFKIFGIEISLDFSWFIIFLLVTWSLASGYFPFKYPFFALGTYWIMGAISSLLLFITVLMHELSHSVVANHNGLNIKGIKLFVFGGVAQLTREPQNARVEFDIAIAGPICSFILYFIFKALAGFLSMHLQGGMQNPVTAIFSYLSFINIFLGLINLIPAYPLDGGRVFRSIVWAITKNFKKATAVASTLGKLFALFLIFTGFMATIRGEFSGLWYVFIGMFLFSSAKAGYENILIKNALNGVYVRDVMSPYVFTVDNNMTLDKVVDDYVFRYHHSSFPIVEGNKIKGMLRVEYIKNISRDKWHTTLASECTEPIGKEAMVSPREKVSTILNRLLEHNITHLLVMEDDKIVGIITRIDIMKLLKFKMELGG
jgi:Zn-dependent protease